MNNVTVHFEVPDEISSGLKSKAYERVGGVIRDSQTKQIVAMLRETAPDLTQASTMLSQLGSVSSLLNVSISVIGFIIIAKKLEAIEQKIDVVQKSLNELHYKYDVSIDAKFKAALNSAQDSIMMRNKQNSISMGIVAINNFSEIQRIYTDYLNNAIENDIQIADRYFSRLSLCYLAKIRCYLELEEIERAYYCVKEGTELLTNCCHIYTKQIKAFNQKSYETAQHVLMGTMFTEAIRSYLPFMSSSITSATADMIMPLFPQNDIKEKTWENIRDIQKICQFFQGYQAEISALDQLEISFHEWQKISSSVSSNKQKAKQMYIIPSKTIF